MIRIFLAASVAALAVAGPAVAQDQVPAEFPPESYTANQYVDSAGCAFVRAGIGGMTNWIPRMNREREQLCGFKPTRTAEAAPLPVVPDSVPEAAPATAADERPAPQPVRRAQAPARRAAAPSSPRVVAPAPVRRAAPRLTLAAFCDGRSGPQPGYVGSRSGKTIDCGGASPPAAIFTGPPLRGAVTLAAVCADMAATGRRYVLQGSGTPVTCGPQAETAPRPGTRLAATRLPAPPSTPRAPAAAGRAAAVTAASTTCARSASGLPRRCGPQAQSPSGLGNAARIAAAEPVGVMAFLDPDAALRRAAERVVLPDPARPPRGYRRAWDDGRLNPSRGVRIIERAGAGQVRAPVPAAPVTVPTGLVARVSTSSAPAPTPRAATAGRFVQIGTFAEGANADRAMARLRGLGLPVAQGRVQRGGMAMRVIATGPFADAATLGRVLGTVRAAGYADAFARR